AHLLRGTAHVDVDDLCPCIDIALGGFGHHRRVTAGDLHDTRLRPAAVVHASPGLPRVPEANVAREHLPRRNRRAHTPAQQAKGQVGHACHRGEREVVRKSIGADTKHETGWALGTGRYTEERSVMDRDLTPPGHRRRGPLRTSAIRRVFPTLAPIPSRSEPALAPRHFSRAYGSVASGQADVEMKAISVWTGIHDCDGGVRLL